MMKNESSVTSRMPTHCMTRPIEASIKIPVSLPAKIERLCGAKLDGHAQRKTKLPDQMNRDLTGTTEAGAAAELSVN
jgi:hypothetical protein